MSMLASIQQVVTLHTLLVQLRAAGLMNTGLALFIDDTIKFSFCRPMYDVVPFITAFTHR